MTGHVIAKLQEAPLKMSQVKWVNFCSVAHKKKNIKQSPVKYQVLTMAPNTVITVARWIAFYDFRSEIRNFLLLYHRYLLMFLHKYKSILKSPVAKVHNCPISALFSPAVFILLPIKMAPSSSQIHSSVGYPLNIQDASQFYLFQDSCVSMRDSGASIGGTRQADGRGEATELTNVSESILYTELSMRELFPAEKKKELGTKRGLVLITWFISRQPSQIYL